MRNFLISAVAFLNCLLFRTSHGRQHQFGSDGGSDGITHGACYTPSMLTALPQPRICTLLVIPSPRSVPTVVRTGLVRQYKYTRGRELVLQRPLRRPRQSPNCSMNNHCVSRIIPRLRVWHWYLVCIVCHAAALQILLVL